ncbi:glycoside hydrolase family 31 protein [Pseudochelatococcus sp. B33]
MDTATTTPQPAGAIAEQTLTISGDPVELQIASVNDKVLRVSIVPLDAVGAVLPVGEEPELETGLAFKSLARLRSIPTALDIPWADKRVRIGSGPLSIQVVAAAGSSILALHIADDGAVEVDYGDAPVFGLGQGGTQFDRRGANFPVVNGQGGQVKAYDMGAERIAPTFDLYTEGARITIPWMVSPKGWGLYARRPFGSIELVQGSARIVPAAQAAGAIFDAFIVVADEPSAILGEYARLTGRPHLPPLWSLGFLQSHRTLETRQEMLDEAKRFRDSELPCDGMIYLGTGFTTSGWNKGHGSFEFNETLFSDPKGLFDDLHADNFKVVLHFVNPPLTLHGAVGDEGPETEAEDHAKHYWERHRPLAKLGIDGWWPDIGDMLQPASRLARIRMYWEGAQLDAPNVRPWALHRNAYAGIQRYGWLWSGDIDSRWKTLETQVPAGLNVAVTGIPYWGTDTGGFFTTPELSGELFVRWFQYSAFCPSFRSHGKTWKLHLPWGWGTGEYGPHEYDNHRFLPGMLPDSSELGNQAVEPICKTYLELRYRLMPYIYSVAREAHDTGVPMMRPLWFHNPDDAEAAKVGSEYYWGTDMLVAPVVEKGATERSLYLPAGDWHDFWTGERVAGGRRVVRAVDLATLPIYVRAGAILPTGPVKQYTAEPSDEPVTLTVYPGRDGTAVVYEDDGMSFDHLAGDFTKTRATWTEATRTLRLEVEPGTKEPAKARTFRVAVLGGAEPQLVTFDGVSRSVVL